tara:strand:- start:6037 stop:8043 length:2007 start_codon:yes stop_codon:yes gene_type:complete
MFSEDNVVRGHKGRAEALGNIIVLSFAIIFARLWYLQIYKGDELHRYSMENRLRKEVLLAPRGMIFSRNNELLVHNTPRFDAVIVPQYLSSRDQVLKKLGQVLEMEEDEIDKILKKNSRQPRYQPVTIKKNISRKEVAVIETENSKMPGVSVMTFISREYQDREVGGHILGYISEISQSQLPKFRERDSYDYKLGDFIGQSGLEEERDLELRGEDGYEFIEVDALGRRKRYLGANKLFEGIEGKPPVPGDNIRLTIDRDMQQAAFKALEGKVGSAVAIDVKTGEVMAMVSHPSFDPGQFSRGISSAYWSDLSNDERNPMRDRTVQEHYSPGSTFKAITAIAALEEGVVDEKTEVHCPGYFQLGRRRFHCWKQYGHGKVNLIKSLRESCDVYYYKIGTQLDIDVLAKYARALGFGNKSGVALPRETPGLIPTKEWKKKLRGTEWQKGETLSCVIGQSFVLSTPLQLAMAYSAIANGGKVIKPTLVKEVFSNSGKVLRQPEPELTSEITLKPQTLALVREGLKQVVNNPKGTSWWNRGNGIAMAGKTGTSQVISMSAEKLFMKCQDKEYRFRHHGVFAAYAPYDDPRIAVSVVVEHGCSGSGAAAPVAKDIVTAFMKKYEPEKMAKFAEIQRQEYLKILRERRRIEAQAADEENRAEPTDGGESTEGTEE